MKKAVIVINGAGGVGKDTLCELASKHFKVYNISSITPIKEVAVSFGWRGEKTDKARKFLADLKALAVEYNDFPTLWAKERYNEFLLGEDEIMFVHIREPEEIKKFVSITGGAAKTLLIRGGKRMTKSRYGNVADDMVECYNYDYYFVNENSFEVAEREFVLLLEDIMKFVGEEK